MKTLIYVATHRPYDLYGDSSYKMVQVGSSLAESKIPGTIPDSLSADNISRFNPIYCELTALYQLWKYEDADIKGLCHYRRYLGYHKHSVTPRLNILKAYDIESLLTEYDIILPSPSAKGKYWQGYFDDLSQACNHWPYLFVRPIIEEYYPDYMEEFLNEWTTKKISFCNIMMCKREIFDGYCSWLFDVLFKLQDNIKQIPPRQMGFLSEWLLNVWVRKNKLNVIYRPMYNIKESYSLPYRILAKIESLLHHGNG